MDSEMSRIQMIQKKIHARLKFFKFHFFQLLFCLFCSLLIIYYGLSITPVLSPDSFTYLDVGKAIHTKGLSSFFSSFTTSTPLFPLLIASGISLGMDPLSSAHLITVLAFAFLIFPVFYLGKEIGNEYVGFCSCILIVTSSTMWHLSTMVWTEMPFILFSVVALLFLVKYIKNNQLSFLIIGGFFIALASMERYVGIFLVFSSVVTIFAFELYLNKQKIWRSLVFLLISSTPVVILLIRNFIIGANITSKNSMPIFESIFYTVYFKVRGVFPAFVRPDNSAFIFLAIILILIIAQIVIIKKGSIPKSSAYHYLLVTAPVWAYIGVFVVIFEIIYLSLQGFGEHGRLQVVIIPIVIIFSLSLFSFTYNNITVKSHKTYYAFLILSVISVTAIAQIVAIPVTYQKTQEGYGDFYCDPCWRNNSGIEWLKANAKDNTVYSTSNDGYQISYYLGKKTSNFPCNGYNSSDCSTKYVTGLYRPNATALKNTSYIIIIEDYCQKKLGYRYNPAIITISDFQQMVDNSSEFSLVKQYPDTAIYQYTPRDSTIREILF